MNVHELFVNRPSVREQVTLKIKFVNYQINKQTNIVRETVS